MMFSKILKKAGFVTVILSALIVSLSSCDVEIGLGSSVDTRAPEITISNPSSGAVIRDVFSMNGTCSDDGIIDSITIDLRQTSNSVLSYSHKGSFNQREGTWSCEINPLDLTNPIPDGNYEVIVTIKDTAGRETIRTKQYTIDNTAPVIAITRPSAVIPTGSDPGKYTQSTEYDSFGQDFVIEGHVADTCERRYISVDVFDLDGKLKYSTLNATDEAKKRIKIDSDFSTTIASFGDEAYKAIYGDDDEAGTKKFFCEITVYDDAYKYPADGSTPSGENAVGNSAKYFYMYEGDLYSTIFDSYGMTNAYKILNGSFSEDDSRTLSNSISLEEAKKCLGDEKYSETRGFWSLNPKNNPYFKVSGHDAFDKDAMENGTVFDDTENHITNNSTVVVEVYPGLDQTPLVQDNLGLYLLMADFYGKPVENAQKIWLVRPLVDEDGTTIITDEEEIAERKNQISKIGSTYKFTVNLSTKKSLPDGTTLHSGDKYLFGVQGWDKKGVQVKNADSVLGFKLIESGTAPSITVKSVTPKWITTNTNSEENPALVTKDAAKAVSIDLAFSGDSPYRLTRIINETEEEEIISKEDNHTADSFIDTYEPPVGAGSGKIKYILTGNNDLICDEEIEFYVDNDRPEVLSLIPPAISESGKSYYHFSGKASDGDGSGSKIADVQMRLSYTDANNNPVVSDWLSVGKSDDWETTVVFQENEVLKNIFLTEGVKKIEVQAIDAAGNISEIKEDYFLHDTLYPEVTETGIGVSEIIVRNDITLSGTASDLNGIKAVVITDSLNPESKWTINVDSMTAGTEPGTYNWTQAIAVETGIGTETNKLREGNHILKITATDISGKQAQAEITRSVIVDAAAPDILTITSPAADDATGAAAISGSSKVFSGNATDNISGLASYSYVFSQSAAVPTEGWTTVAAENGNWSITRTVSSTTQPSEGCLHEGEWYLFIKAKDKAGNETQTPVTRHFWIDQSVPALTNVNLAAGAGTGTYFFKTAALTVSGKAIDTHVLAENAVVIKKGDVTVATINRADVGTDGSWEVTLDEEVIPNDGTSTALSIEVKDIVGKSSGVNTYNVCKDMVSPVATVSPAADTALTYQKSVNYEFTGTASDTNLDEVTAELYKNGTKAEETTLTLDRATNTWKWKVYDLEEATYNIKVTAKDKADNRTECQSGSIKVDTIAPVTTVNGTALYESNGTTAVTEISDGENVEAGTYYAQSSYVLSGVVTDSNFECSAASFIFKENGTEKPVTFTGTGTSSDPYNWTYTPASFADGTYAYTITVTDKAQNKTVYSFTIVYDTTAPVVVIASPESTAYSSAPEANGTVRDAGIGIAEVKWSIDNSTWSATDWTSGTNWSVDLGAMEHEGSVTLYVKAKDKFGKEASQNVSFSYDLNNPVVAETDSVAGYQKAGYTFTLTGTAYDTNALSYIEIVDRIGNTVQGTYRVDNDDSTTDTITITNGTIAAAKSAESALTWSKTFAYNDSTPLEEGQHTFTITAKDTAEKTSNTATKTVFVDTVAPQIQITAASIPNVNDTANPSFRFRGTAQDNENGSADSGIEVVQLKIKSYNTADGTVPAANASSVNETDWIEASGTTGWLYTAVFSELSNVFNTSGYKKLFVQAIDEAGNESDIYESDYFLYDTSEPTVTLNNYKLNDETSTRTLSNVASAFISDNFTLNATVTDDYRIATIVVKQGDTEIERITNKNGTNETISIANLPRNEENTGALSLTTSGEYTFTITATDAAGKTVTSAYFTTTVDKEKPVINITTPNADLGKSAALSQVSYTFRGDASDNEGGSGIAKYRYMFNHSATEPQYTDTNWSAEQELTASWTLAQTLVEGNDAVANGLYEGEWYLWMYAIDAAGNKSDIISRHFWVDKNNPSLTSTVSENSAASNTVVAVSGIYYFDEAISGTASATDSSNTTPAISFWIGETELDEEDVAWGTGTDSNKWTISKDTFDALVTANTLANNTLYRLTIRAKDVVDKVTDKEYSIYRDTAVPTVTIESPADGSNHQSQEITVRGTTGDAGGSGVISIEYSTKGTDYSPLNSFTPGGQSWSTSQQLSVEGDITVYVKATDRLGRTADDNVSFYYDAAIPSLEETDDVAGPGDADSFTLTGKAWDSNGVSRIDIYDSETGKTFSNLSGEGRTAGSFINITTPQKTVPTGNTWSANFVVNNSDADNYFGEGSHSLTIKVYDVAGRASDPVYKTIFVDREDPVVTITTPDLTANAAKATTNQTAYVFRGTVEEVNISTINVSLYEYNANGTDSLIRTESVAPIQQRDAENEPISGMYDWSYSGYGFESNKEYYITVDAVDRGSRHGSATSTGNKVLIDNNPPEIAFNTLTGIYTITEDVEHSTVSLDVATSLESGKTYYSSATTGYSITGTITDTSIDSANSTLKIDNGTATALSSLTSYNGNTSNGTWTVSGITESHIYSFTLKDKAGNTATSTITVKYDTTAPEVTIVNPAEHDANGKTLILGSDSDSYSFKVNAADGTAGVGLQTVKYQFTQSNTAIADSASGWQDGNVAAIEGAKFIAMNLVAGTTGSSASQLCEGTWYLHVIATDKAGNASDDVIREFVVDKANPVTTVKANGNNDELNPNDVYYFNAGNLTLTGTITETHVLSENDAVKISKTVGNTSSPLATIKADGTEGSVNTSTGAWSVSIPTSEDGASGIKDNEMTLITITVKDKAGKSTSYKYNVYNDTVAPTINITSITNGEAFDSETLSNVGGTIVDAGSGVDSTTVSYVLKRGTITVADGSADGTADDLILSGSRAQITTLPLFKEISEGVTTGEGELILTVTASDKAGNEATQTINFSYDLANPVLSETGVGASGKTTNGSISFSGTAYDSNELVKIEFTDTSVSESVIADKTISINSNEETSWNKTFTFTNRVVELTTEPANWPTGYYTNSECTTVATGTFTAGTYYMLPDGEHVFKIVAYDKAGKSREQQRTVVVDTQKPVISSVTVTDKTTISEIDYYNSKAVPIVVTSSDTGSGISTIKYTTDAQNAGTRNWVALALDSNNNGTYTYKGNVTCVEGSNTIYVKAIDVAENESEEGTVTITVDTTAPVFELASVGSTSLDDLEEGQTLSGIKLVNGSSSLSFTGTVTETGSGIKSVIAKIGNNTITSESSSSPYVITIEPSKMPSDTTSVIVTVEDEVGNTKDFTAFQLRVDNKYPIATVGEITDADISTDDVEVNGTITVSGTASDTDTTLIGIQLQYQISADGTAWGNWTDYIRPRLSADTEDPTELTSHTGTPYSWSYNIDTTVFTDGNYVRFRALATDEAGNTGNSGTTTSPASAAGNTRTVKISQDTDRPVIKISNLLMATPVENGSSYYWHPYNTMYGTVQDDDGTVESVKYEIHKAVVLSEEPDNWPTGYYTDPVCTTATAATGTFVAETYYTKSNLSANIYSNGMWEIPSLEDGQADIYFEVKDAAGNTFTCNTTSTTSTSYGPKIKDSEGNEKLGYSSTPSDIIKVKIDTYYPSILTPKYYLSSNASDSGNTTWNAASNLGELATKNSGGPTNRYLFARIEATDSNGIDADSCEFKFESEICSETNDKITQMSRTASGNSVAWIIRVDLYQFATGTQTFSIKVKDTAGKENSNPINVLVDNTAPNSISNVRPGPNEPVSGTVNYRGNIGDNTDGIGILYETNDSNEVTRYGVEYYIPTYEQANVTDKNAAAAAITSGWLYPTTKGTVSWEIEFTNLGQRIGYTSSTYQVGEEYRDFERNVNGTGTGLYDIPIWFRLTDKLGNVGYITNNSIYYNPNDDRPTVQITYPTYAQGQNSVTMGGTINITGMASDDDGIEAVYLQFDMGGDSDDDYENGIGITGSPFTDSDLVDIPHTDPVLKGVPVSGTKSWYKTFNIANLTHNTTIKVRAIARENGSDKNNESEYLYSAWSDVLNINVNTLIPSFSNIKLKKYTTTPTAGTLATGASGEMDYSADMFIKGSETNWYLTGQIDVSNNATVDTVSVSGSKTLSYTNDNNTANDTLISYLENNQKICHFAIPVTLDAGTAWSIRIDVKDKSEGTPQSNNYQATINLDSTAPVFTDTNGQEITLYKNAYGSGGIEISTASIDNYIQNSNGNNFTLAGKVREDGSGFERLVFYFKRTTGSGNSAVSRVYNPMKAYGSDYRANRTDLAAARADGSVYINDEGLPALYLSSVTRNDNVSVASDSIASNDNIRVGGLVKIGGAYRIIEGVNGTSGIVTFIPACDTSYNSDVEFIYGLVVDTNNENDDHDGMTEAWSKSGTNYIWDATIDSKNIPDGPIEIHCVAFDKAGNTNHGYTTTKVSNNPPRITSVMLGTDLNADNSYKLGSLDSDDSEFVTFYVSKDSNGNGNTSSGTEIWNLEAKLDDTNYWTAKKGLVVIPEFVGGTGTIYYNYSKSTDTSNSGKLQSAQKGTVGSTIDASDNRINGTIEASRTTNKIGAIILDNGNTDSLTTVSTTDGELSADYNSPNVYRFSFWDSTEGCIPGEDSQWSVLNAIFMQDLVDNIAPTGTITPFHWTSLTNNSVYTSKTGENITSIADLEGHIELEGDLPTDNNDFDASSGEFDRDPKVSGKIKVEGNAYDETLLKTIAVTFANKTARATYDSGSGWTYSGNENGIYMLEVEDVDGPIQTGHSVTWKLIADTSFVVTNKVAAADVIISVTVNDASSVNEGNGNSSTPGNDQTTSTTKTGYYKVDIVPYISGVKTSLSSIKKTNSSIYDRTALGHYPTAINETSPGVLTYDKIYLYGFNLKNSKLYDENDTADSGNLSEITITNSNKSLYKWYYDDFEYKTVYESGSLENFKSGEVYVQYNGIKSLNNINKNDAKGNYTHTGTEIGSTGNKTVYKNYYNRQPNGDNNNLLTDDVILDIWEFHSDAVVPISGNIEQPQMKINPVTGQLGFAFVNGPLYFSMPGNSAIDKSGTEYSYKYWCSCLDFFTSIGLTYDKNGYSYAVEAGGDINTNTADKFSLLSDRFGTALDYPGGDGPGQASKQSAKLIRMDLIGMKGTKSNQTDETNYFEKQRFKSPSLTTTVHGPNTNVYLAYYDAMTDQIRFKSGTRSGGYDIGTTAAKQFNATEYMKWYYHAIYKQEEGVNQNRSFVIKDGAAVNSPSEPIQATISGVTLSQNVYDVESCTDINTSTGVSDSGNPVILIVKDKNAEEMDALVQQIVTTKLTAKGLGSEADAYDSIMTAAEAAYNAGTSTDFWGLKTTYWNSTTTVKKALEEIKITVTKRTPKSVTKVFGDFKDTETAKIPRIYNDDTVWIIAGDGTDNNAGEYVSIGVVSSQEETPIDTQDDDVVVGVWYDSVDRVLKYSYNTNPTRLRSSEGAVATEAGWETPITVFSGDQENAGEYCQLVVDGKGGIHIAAYDSVNSDLVYAYLSSYNATPQTCVVDSSGVIGTNLTIDVAMDDSGESAKAIPRISYYSNSCVKPKLAYLADTTSVNPAGADDEEFTGKWEITVVPTGSTLNTQSAQYNKINVAVWKTAAGVLTNCTNSNTFTQTNVSSDNAKTNNVNAFNSDSYGQVYGNGTSNAILGYAVKNGTNSTIETAQMK